MYFPPSFYLPSNLSHLVSVKASQGSQQKNCLENVCFVLSLLELFGNRLSCTISPRTLLTLVWRTISVRAFWEPLVCAISSRTSKNFFFYSFPKTFGNHFCLYYLSLKFLETFCLLLKGGEPKTRPLNL